MTDAEGERMAGKCEEGPGSQTTFYGVLSDALPPIGWTLWLFIFTFLTILAIIYSLVSVHLFITELAFGPEFENRIESETAWTYPVSVVVCAVGSGFARGAMRYYERNWGAER